MSNWYWTDRLWTFDTARFSVHLDVTFEDDPDFSWDESGEVLKKVEDGEWGNYCFKVSVHLDGREVAADYLGNSIYADPAEFRREHVGARGRWGSYFPGMVHNTVKEARKALRDVPRLRHV